MILTLSILTAFCLVNIATPSRAQPESAQIEAAAKEIELLLIAPCCWRQPIADHQSEVVSEMKGQIREMLREGKNRQEILDSYVERYGVRILSVPPQVGFNRLSFLMPVFFVLAGLAVVGACLRKWQRSASMVSSHRAANEAEPVTHPADDEISRRIKKELDAME